MRVVVISLFISLIAIPMTNVVCWGEEVDPKVEVSMNGPMSWDEFVDDVKGLASGVKEMVESMSDADTADAEATYLRNLYVSLVDKGFTEEQAMEIVKSRDVSSFFKAQGKADNKNQV